MFKAPSDLRADRTLGMQLKLLYPRRSHFAPITKLSFEAQSIKLIAQRRVRGMKKNTVVSKK